MAQPTKINDQLSVLGQITLADIPALAQAGFAAIINNRPDDEEPGQLNHDAVEAEAKKHGLDYRYQPVVSSAISRRDVSEFQNLLARGGTPVVAHCRSGTRCYMLWAASRALFAGESPLKLVAEAAAKGYDLRALPHLVEKLEAEK